MLAFLKRLAAIVWPAHKYPRFRGLDGTVLELRSLRTVLENRTDLGAQPLNDQKDDLLVWTDDEWVITNHKGWPYCDGQPLEGTMLQAPYDRPLPD
jgi:hypothetical protein